jgi:hypothetical protein
MWGAVSRVHYKIGRSIRFETLATRTGAGAACPASGTAPHPLLPLIAGAVTLGSLAVANRAIARRAERKHPPEGSFLVVDGVRLHYSDRGVGSPIVLIHGNAVTGDDWNTSGVAELLLHTHRVIIFDRPGFGDSASVIMPPSNGPATLQAANTPANKPWYRPRSRGENRSPTVRQEAGAIQPVKVRSG